MVSVRLDRLLRSASHLLEVIEDLIPTFTEVCGASVKEFTAVNDIAERRVKLSLTLNSLQVPENRA